METLKSCSEKHPHGTNPTNWACSYYTQCPLPWLPHPLLHTEHPTNWACSDYMPITQIVPSPLHTEHTQTRIAKKNPKKVSLHTYSRNLENLFSYAEDKKPESWEETPHVHAHMHNLTLCACSEKNSQTHSYMCGLERTRLNRKQKPWHDLFWQSKCLNSYSNCSINE